LTRLAAQLRRIPWRRYSLAWPVLLLILFGSIGMAAVGVYATVFLGMIVFHANIADSPGAATVIWNFFGVAALITGVAIWPPCGKVFAKLGIRPLKWLDVWIAVATCTAILLFSGAVTVAWQAFLDWAGIPYQEEQDLLKEIAGASPAALILLGFVLTVTVPIAEEIFFRRLLFGLFRPLGAWTAILLTSFLFACAHFFLYGMPALFLMGLGFQLTYLLRRNLSAAILVHGLINFCALAGTLLESSGS